MTDRPTKLIDYVLYAYCLICFLRTDRQTDISNYNRLASLLKHYVLTAKSNGQKENT